MRLLLLNSFVGDGIYKQLKEKEEAKGKKSNKVTQSIITYLNTIKVTYSCTGVHICHRILESKAVVGQQF